MHRERRVGMTAPVALIFAALALAACSSDPPPAEDSIVPLLAAPVTLPRLTGGQAMKAFIDPLTGELRSPAEVEGTVPDGTRARIPTTRVPMQVLQTRGGGSVRPISNHATGQLRRCTEPG
jgi:hypothetical protein